MAFHGVAWAPLAPPVERLTIEWQQPGSNAFRISDWDSYVWQMQRLLGLR
ncbi:MAG TPA: hypothetical protein PKB03_04535 [Baekduia sp.]|nr:hypothetical protein [Baekduia sp.]